MTENNVKIKKTKYGENIIVVDQGQETILNSAVDPEYASDVYANGYAKELKEFDVMIIFGFSDGRIIRKLAEQVSETVNFIIYEPERKIFEIARENFDIEDIIDRSNVRIYVEKDGENHMGAIFKNHINFYNCRKTKYTILPNYNIVFDKETEQFCQKVKFAMNDAIIEKNTSMTFEVNWRESGMQFWRQVVDMRDIYGLKEEFVKHDIKNIPAIIVGAGPSLDKNIKELKAAVGKSFIIATDAALRVMSNYDILPDMAVNVDGLVPQRFFDNTDMSRIPMVLCSLALSSLFEDENIAKFMDGSTCDRVDEIDKEILGRTNAKLPTGGSVSTDAFCLATYLGFERIIFIGQDLSYPGGKHHYDGLEEIEEKNINFTDRIAESRKLEVEDVYGKKVITDMLMKWYLEWLEMAIYDLKGIHVIDATEGGAKIKGTEIMSLKDAVLRECKREIDFRSIIKQVPSKYTMEQREKVIGEMKREPMRLRSQQEKIDNAVMDYDRLISLAKVGKESTEEFKVLYKKAIQMNNFEDVEPTYKLLRYYNLKQIYEEDTDIYERDYILEELLASAKNLLQGYSRAIDEYLKDYQRIVLDTL